MAKKWREIGGYREAVQLDIKEETGQITEGIYDGYQENVGDNNSTVHYIIIDGTACSFWGTKVLDARLMKVKPGTEVRITYNGVVKSKVAGRKGYHDFKIEVAEEDGEEEETPTPKVTKPAKKTAPKVEDTDEGEVDEEDIPF